MCAYETITEIVQQVSGPFLQFISNKCLCQRWTRVADFVNSRGTVNKTLCDLHCLSFVLQEVMLKSREGWEGVMSG